MPPEATDRRTDPDSDRRHVRRGGRRSSDPRHSYDQELFERYGLQRRGDPDRGSSGPTEELARPSFEHVAIRVVPDKTRSIAGDAAQNDPGKAAGLYLSWVRRTLARRSTTGKP
jgi:hypothetical protein